ncbi:photosystem I iron-sulfur center [Desulfosporosinus acididurans]|uniref:Photosystem I iron-sulfur center n=1 Tax=Desulfosporosinus acididurans TaxID=476652 RepID=A0A0J1FN65_9FIRM|nr:aldo/keto reductase [Desulfosporosinus acididurans]KLU64915.1 photosystem I iron-sulfur center [Desulfosporosinus acididurans]
MGKQLGFGCMRLPLLDKNDQTSVDKETVNKLVDTFLEEGFTYFDTAYVYHSYMSESIMREALVKRHKRDEFELATKLPMRDVKTVEDQEKVFNEQLEKCGVEYFDYYLLHNLGVITYKKACELDSFGFGMTKKKEGKIKSLGMSFHDSPELLDEILTAHPELDFVQLQINYIDWENPSIQSRRCYEVARKHNKPIIVMEPCKGGSLALVPEKAEKVMKEYNPKASVPSWAIRFAASQEGVFMVLSGMNSIEQVRDNTSYMADFKPLNEEEYNVINQVIETINENTAIPCTICRYCEKGCPKKIAIPDYFALYNSTKRATTNNFSSQFVYYLNLAANHGRASDCIGCKECEKACPQHLKITEHLKDVSAVFDAQPQFPTRKE